MATITEQQAALAAVLSGVMGATVRTVRPVQAKAMDGWVNVGKVAPGLSTTTCDCTFTCVVALGSDERKAAELIASLSVPIVNAVTTGPLHPDAVSLEPAILPVGDVSPGDMYALILTLTLEVA